MPLIHAPILTATHACIHPTRRFGEGCTAAAVATARGYVGLHLLAGEAAPAWCEAAPQCVSDGPEMRAVRSQVSYARYAHC